MVNKVVCVIYLSYVGYSSFEKYNNDTFRIYTNDLNSPRLKHNEKVLQSGKKNCLVQCNCCDKQCSENCLPLLLFKLNYCVTVATRVRFAAGVAGVRPCLENSRPRLENAYKN